MLHLCQPIEPRLEELGKARPNGGVTYLGVDEFHIYIYIYTLKTFEALEVK
jgi:hypothetical protein